MGHRVKDSIVWGGRRWWLNGGYYCNRRGQLLHRAVYASFHGPIPEGIEIHHIDENKTNNAIDNLEALTRSEHLKRHRPRGWTALPLDQRAIRVRELWATKEPHRTRCGQCGNFFETTGTRAKFCSGNCRAAHRRRDPIQCASSVCAYCGQPFLLYREGLKFCSSACSSASKRKSERNCIVCTGNFWATDPRTVCCSRQCGYMFRSQRIAA